MGQSEAGIIAAAMRRGQPLPDAIAGAPSLLPGLGVYFEAFRELSTCRDHGMAVGPIPWTAIDRYASRHHFYGEDFDYLVAMVRALDDAFLAHTRRKEQEARKAARARHGDPDE